MFKNKIVLVALLLISLGLVARLLPHPPNFAPIAAIALFAGIYLSGRWVLILPVAAMFVSDIFIGFYNPKIMIAVYICFALTAVIGLLVKKNKKFSTILGGTLLGSILFFLITNAAVWAFGTMYPHNLTGLFESYTMAMPFFRNSLLGDLFFVGILVGSMESVMYYLRKPQAVKIKS